MRGAVQRTARREGDFPLVFESVVKDWCTGEGAISRVFWKATGHGARVRFELSIRPNIGDSNRTVVERGEKEMKIAALSAGGQVHHDLVVRRRGAWTPRA